MTRKIVLALAVLAGTASTAIAASSPSVRTGSATSIKEVSAVLNGSINPNGAVTKYWIEWGLTNSYGSTSAVHSLSAGTTAVSVHLTANGLSPDVTYHYRLFAQNSSGTSSGADRTFKTTGGHPLPVAETQPANSITTGGALISGLVDPNGVNTPTEFQWGITPYLGNTVSSQIVPSNTPLETVSALLSALAPGSTFYYRVLVYRGVSGWIPASTLSFTTLPLSRPYAGLHASTSPHHNHHEPFTFTTTGSISGPFPAGAQCTGTVALSYFAAGRKIKERSATVQPNCAFSYKVVIFHTFAAHDNGPRPKVQTVQITIRFRGNGYLAPKMSTQSVVIG